MTATRGHDEPDEREPDVDDVAHDDDDEAVDHPDWLLDLGDDHGRIRPTLANVITVLTRHAEWNGVIAFDELAAAIITTRAPRWFDDDAPARVVAGPWTDEDTSRLCAWLTRELQMEPRSGTVREAVAVVARRNALHPVSAYLESLAWDRAPRIDTWLVDHCGAADTRYTRAVGAMTLISAVARAMKPGCKVDTVMVLTGPQGAGKSRLIRALGGDDWTLETAADVGTKDALQILRGKWLIELSELDALSRSEAAAVKAHLSAQVDTYRPSYGRQAIDYPRQCIMIGTTNAESFLRDETGGRRFWPVAVKSIDVERIRELRDELWAEAHARYLAGAAWHITDAAVLRDAEDAQADRFAADPWEAPIAKWLLEQGTKTAARPTVQRRATAARPLVAGVTTGEVMAGALGMQAARMTRADETRVGAVLRRLGWEPRQVRVAGGARVRRYMPPADRATHGRDGCDGVGPLFDAENKADRSPSQPSQPKSPNKGVESDQGVEDGDQGRTGEIPRIGSDGCDSRPQKLRRRRNPLRIVGGSAS